MHQVRKCALTFTATSNENGRFAHPLVGSKVICAPNFWLVPSPICIPYHYPQFRWYLKATLKAYCTARGWLWWFIYVIILFCLISLFFFCFFTDKSFPSCDKLTDIIIWNFFSKAFGSSSAFSWFYFSQNWSKRNLRRFEILGLKSRIFWKIWIKVRFNVMCWHNCMC